jgi:hypothetical protein
MVLQAATSEAEEFSDYGKFLLAHRWDILFGGSNMEQITAFLEFEWIFGIGVAFVIILMILFYIVYPYDKDLKELPQE